MSIFIKDMKMPKCCSDCLLNYDQMACAVTGTRWWSDRIMLMGFDSEKERLYDCPLIEIPTPHGRLIDADILKEVLERNFGHTGGASVLAQLIDARPTVIEAEGSEE